MIRSAGNLLALFGSNSNSSPSAGAIGDVLTGSTSELTPKEQRGHCRGRRIGLSVVDLDSYSKFSNALLDGINFHMLGRIDISNVPAWVLDDLCNGLSIFCMRDRFWFQDCLVSPWL